MLETKDLQVRFPSGFVAADGVSVGVEPGQVLSLCGPNGAGKSTVLSVLAGDLRPTQGEALLDGYPIRSLPIDELARRRAVLEQSPSLSAPFSVERLAGLSIGIDVPPDRADAIVRRSLADVGLSDRAKSRSDILSGGEKHRAHFARVLSQLDATGEDRQKYLLLDEPTASLDIVHQITVMRVARRAAGIGVGVLVILHDLNLAAAFSDRVALMHRGRVVSYGAPREVFTSERLSDVYGTAIDVDQLGSGGVRIAPVFEPLAA